MEGKSFLRLPIFKLPMCLISSSKDGKLQVVPETLEQIKQINAKLVVVAIAGLYRTGKSYLMNRLAGSSYGFSLGSSIESKTKGIWVWCRNHPVKENTVLMLLDTEGLGDVEKGDSDHDNRIFTIAALLSNVLVYNMMSSFNQDTIEKITFITELSKNIRCSNTKDDVNEEEMGLILPTFVLCLRDFFLDLEKDGNEITPDEYLDNCLQLKRGDKESVARYNRPRECIRKYFPKRKCFTFDRPGDRDTMRNLETVPFEKLNTSFVKETNIFLNYIYSCGPKVLIGSKPLNGGMFVTLVHSYLNAIRHGAVPDVDDAFMTVANIENEKMAKEAVEMFEKKIEEIKLPILLTRKMEELNRDIQEAALAQFRIGSMFNAEKFEKLAMSMMNKLWEKIKMDNLVLVRQHCESLYQALYIKHIGNKLSRGEYKVAGGYPLFKLNMDAMKRDYMSNVKGIDTYEAQQVLVNFLNEEAQTESDIMFEDQRTTEEDRKRELEKLQAEHAQAEASQQRLYEDKLQEEKQRAEEHQKEMNEKREEHMKCQKEKMTALENEWGAQRNLTEKQLQLMQTQNEFQRKSFEEQVKRLATDHQRMAKNNKDWFDSMISKENENAQKKVENVKEKIQYMLENKKIENNNMEKNIQLQQDEIIMEQARREDMRRECEHNTKEFKRRMNTLDRELRETDARNEEVIRRLKRDINASRNKSSRSGCDII